MKKGHITISVLIVISAVFAGYFANKSVSKSSFGATILKSFQLATSPSSGTFAWTSNSWGNSTTSTLGFLNGFFSTASSTIVNTNFLSNGNVGIGSSSPNHTLTVGGTGIFSNGQFNESSTYNGIFIGKPSGATSIQSGRILFTTGTASKNWQIDNDDGTFRWFLPGVVHMRLSSGNGLELPNTSSGILKASGTGNSYFAGNLGVASTSPTKNLSVGTANAGTFAIATSTSGCATFSGIGELYSTGSPCGSSSGSSAYEIATTSTIAVPQLSYFTQVGGRTTLGGVSTTTANCSGTVSCSQFTVLGSSPITITGSAGTSASSTLLSDFNTWTGRNNFTWASTTQLDVTGSATSTFAGGIQTGAGVDVFGTASSSALNVNGNVTFPLLPQGIAYVGSNGLLNTTATSSFSLSGFTNDLANLTAGSGLTSAGTYNGSVARTFSLDTANPNSWTGLQTFNYSSSTIYSSFLTASTTFLRIGLSDGCLNITSGLVGSTGSACGSGGGLSSYNAWSNSSLTVPNIGVRYTSATTSALRINSYATTTIGNLQGVMWVPTDYATNGCAGDATKTDFGACVNALYSLASTSGNYHARIRVPLMKVPAANWTTAINANISGLAMNLQCEGSQLIWGGSATSTIINHGDPTGHLVSEISGCVFMGNSTLIAAGQSNTKTTGGIHFGGSNGAVGVNFHDNSVNGFGQNLSWGGASGGNAYMINIQNNAISGGNGNMVGNTMYIGVANNSGERNNFIGNSFTDPSDGVATSSIYIADGSTASNFFTNNTIDNVGIYCGASNGQCYFSGNHFENPGAPSGYGQYIPIVNPSSDGSTSITLVGNIFANSASNKTWETIVKHGGQLYASGNRIDNYNGFTVTNFADHSNNNGQSSDHICQTQVQGGSLTNLVAGSGGLVWSLTNGVACSMNRSNSYTIGMRANGSNTNDFYSGSVTTGTFDHSGNWTFLNNATVGNDLFASNTAGISTTTTQYKLSIRSTGAAQLALSNGAGSLMWAFRGVGGNLYLATTTVAGNATTSISALEINGTSGTTTLRGLNISGYATSTSNVGFNITSGCYAINGTCISGGGGSGTVTSVVAGEGFLNRGLNITSSGTLTLGIATGTTPTVGQLAYWGSVGDTTNSAKLLSVATSTPTVGSSLSYTGTFGNVIGGSSGTLSLNLANPNTWTALQTFANSSTTLGSFSYSSSTEAHFGTGQGIAYIGSNGLLGATATSSFSLSGFTNDLANLSATDSTLTFSGSYNGSVARTVGLNLANPNTWSALQTFGNSSTTLGSFGYASSTLWYGGGLQTCDPTTGKLTWSNGVFGCGTDQTSGGGTYPDFSYNQTLPYGRTGSSTSTPIHFSSGITASSTNYFAYASSTQFTADESIQTVNITQKGANALWKLINTNDSLTNNIYTQATYDGGQTGWTDDTIRTYIGKCFTGGNTIFGILHRNSVCLTRDNFYSVLDNGYGLAAFGTGTPQYLLTLASSTVPQLSLSSGGGIAQWVMRNAGGNLYFATTTIAGTATTSTSALSISNGGLLTFGAASSTQLSATSWFGLPNGTSPSLTAVGSLALDTTSNNIVFATSTTGNAIVAASATTTLAAFNASTTSITSGTIWNIPVNRTKSRVAVAVYCDVSSGTSLQLFLSDGTNNTNTITCTTTPTQYELTTNNTWNAYENWRIEFGTKTGDTGNVSVEILGYKISD